MGLVVLLGLLLSGYLALRLNHPGTVGTTGGKPAKSGRGGPGAVLVVVQFTGAVTLMSGALIVYEQMRFLHRRELGFQPDRVLVVAAPAGEEAGPRIRAFKERLESNALVRGVSLCDIGGAPGSFMNKDLFLVEQDGQMREKVVTNLDCDAGYLPLLRIKLRKGRNFSADRPADRAGAYLVNEAFVRWMGWAEPLGKRVEFFGRRGEVIGVVNDFHFASLRRQVPPLIILYGQRNPEKILLKTEAAHLHAARRLAEKTWRELLPDYPFECTFLDQTVAAQYRQERRMGQLFGWGSGIAVGVACLGLFGMASLSAGRRTKEIGIRKVLGAGRGSIVFLLLKDFLPLVLLGLLPALPLAWYLGNRWLEAFAWRVPSVLFPVALAGGITFGLALLTTLFHSLYAGRTAPAQALRTE